MTENIEAEGFTDAEWAIWEPLIEAVRPRGKTPLKELRRTMAAIFWRHRNGATWRAIPAELGPWWQAAQLFIRWAALGAWERLLELAQERGRPGIGPGFPGRDQHPGARQSGGSAQKGGTAKRRDQREALGRSRGGFGTKAVAVADAGGRAVAFALAPGQAHEAPMVPALLDGLPDAPGWVVGDRGLSSDHLRRQTWNIGARPAIPAKRNEAPVRCPDFIYVHRNRIERLWGRLKEWWPWRPAMRRPPAPSWASSAWPPLGTGSTAQSKVSNQALTEPSR